MLPPDTVGKPRREFIGREEPPVLEANVPGHTFLLKANRLGSISLGSPVFFRDLNVGEVLGWDIADMAESVTVHAFVRAPFDSYVHDQTRFWDASGLSVKLAGTGVEIQLESLRALLLGGIAFETPQTARPGEVSAEDHVFPLFANQNLANAASYSRKIPMLAYFPGSVSGLASGSEVTMHGLVVGRVTDVRLVYDAGKDAVLAPVRFEVEPERVLGVGRRAFATPAEGVDQLVKQGLRATLQSASLITGQQVVALDFIPNPPPATVTMSGEDFVLPTTDGGGLASIETSATELLRKVNTIPFAQIGKNLDGTLQAANNITNGPELQQALTDLSGAIKSVDNVVQHLDSDMTPALRRLPEIAADAQKTMANASRLVMSLDNGYGDNTKFNRELERLLLQTNDAVRSIRSLADLLSRHPEALIKGRPAGGLE
jgi:paraquat-inducible protein B